MTRQPRQQAPTHPTTHKPEATEAPAVTTMVGLYKFERRQGIRGGERASTHPPTRPRAKSYVPKEPPFTCTRARHCNTRAGDANGSSGEGSRWANLRRGRGKER